MNFASAIVKGDDAKKMSVDLCDQIHKDLDKQSIDLAILFVTGELEASAQLIHEELQKNLNPHILLGCSAGSVISHDEEIETEAAISLFCASMPDVKKIPFSLSNADLERLTSPSECQAFFNVTPEENPIFLVLGEPFSFDINQFIKVIENVYPNTPMVGGMASAGSEPDQNVMFSSEQVSTQGAVGVVLTGNVHISTLVSQGCRPFGEPAIVTEAEENIIHTLAGKSALQFLEENYRKASARDQVLARQALFVGAVVDELKQIPEHGDFVIRSVVGLDQNSGAIALSDRAKVGDTVQFHVRDSSSAHEDLELICSNEKTYSSSIDLSDPKGALIFSCNGRGFRMFNEKNHDVSMLRQKLGKFPAAGFFCAGELGPIGNKNFIHSFTASIALFYEKKQ